jgi:hypothetical protein
VKPNPELMWNLKAVIEDLQKNHLKIEELKWWPRWKRYYLELPEVWKFKWLKFCCITSNDRVPYHIFNRDGYNASFSWKKLWKIGKYLCQYLKEYWIKFDGLDLMDEDEFIDSMIKLLQAVLWLEWKYWSKDSWYVDYWRKIVDFYEWCISNGRTDSKYKLLLETQKIEPDEPIPHNDRRAY